MPEDKGEKVIAVLKKNPALVQALNAVLTLAYQKAAVTLTDSEKEDFFDSLGHAIKNKSVTGF